MSLPRLLAVSSADASPHGITKPEWSTVPPFVRPISFTPLICLDALHPNLVSSVPAPSFLAIPATPHSTLVKQVIQHAQSLSAIHRIPSIVCSKGISAAIDETGDISHEQVGGTGFIAKMVIPWHGDGGTRSLTLAGSLGSTGTLGLITLAIIALKAGEVYWNKGVPGVLAGADAGARRIVETTDDARQRLIGWRESLVTSANSNYTGDDGDGGSGGWFSGFKDFLGSIVDEEGMMGLRALIPSRPPPPDLMTH